MQGQLSNRMSPDEVTNLVRRLSYSFIAEKHPEELQYFEPAWQAFELVLPLLESSSPDTWQLDSHQATALDAYGQKVVDSVVPGAIYTYRAVLTELAQSDVFPAEDRVRPLVEHYARRFNLPKIDIDALVLELSPLRPEMMIGMAAAARVNGKGPAVYSPTSSPSQVAILPETLHQRLIGFAAKSLPTSNFEYVVFIKSAIGFGKRLPADREIVEQLRHSKANFSIFFDDAAGEVRLGPTRLTRLNPDTQHYLVLALLLKDVGNRQSAGKLATKLGEVSTKLGRTASFSDPMIRNLVFQLRDKHTKLRELIELSGGYRISDGVITCLIVRSGEALSVN